jgi:hypothetical protein
MKSSLSSAESFFPPGFPVFLVVIFPFSCQYYPASSLGECESL